MIGISVLLPVYLNDHPIYLDLALQSISTQQIRAPEEIIIVKDGPISDELNAVIEKWQNIVTGNLKTVQLAVNVGLASALNIGIDNCNMEYIARMDADDISSPERFHELSEFIKNNPNVDVIGSYAIEIDEHGKESNLRRMPISHQDIVDNIWLNPFIHPSVVFKKNSLLKIGGYDSKLKRRQDYELWFRAVRSGLNLANIPKPLLFYRFSSNTHKKQSLKIAFEQGLIGFNGCRSLNISIAKGLACFIPFLRCLMPTRIQHFIYKLGQKWDPRNAKKTI